MPLKKRPYTIGGYSVHQYEFTPDAALGAAISTGDQQGSMKVSGPSDEIVKRIISYCETAPLTSNARWQIEYASAATGNAYEDLNAITAWAEVDLFDHTFGATNLTIISTSFSANVIPARRAIRFNVDLAGGTPAQNVTVIMEVHRPLQ